MHNIELIMTLTGGLTAALVFGYLTHRLGLSPIVGYLLAGVAVGRHSPGFVANQEIAEQLAEIGVILLMFGVGLHFDFKDLLKVRRVAIPGAIGQSIVATALGAVTAHFIGWDWTSGIVFGLAISVASTVVLARVLTDNRDLHTPTGRIAIGWLVVEDIFTVLILVMIPAFYEGQQGGLSRLPMVLGLTALEIGALAAGMVVIGGRIIPFLLTHVAATRSRELFTLTVLVLALGIAAGSAQLFGVSMALGAFLAGMVVGRSDFSVRAASEALPMRDAFAVLFFVSVGMLLRPAALLEAPGLAAATLAIIVIGKPLAAFVIVLALKYPLKVALSVGVALAQIGEFSFLLATVAREHGIFEEVATNTLVAASIISITINPALYRLVNPAHAWLSRQPFMSSWVAARTTEAITSTDSATSDEPHGSALPHRAIVVGYGPVGQTVTRLLQENGIRPSVIEMNLETVRRLRQQGIAAVYGDASHTDTLVSAGIETAGSLILTAEIPQSEEVIRQALESNPALWILARSVYVKDLAVLRRAGAQAVFSGESEVALALTETILRQLGATPEQIDRERARVHESLLG